MRSIEFRAMDARLPKDKVHWIYGAFVKHLPYTPAPIGTPPIPDSDYEYAIVNDAFSDWQMPRNLQITPVYPETVGEFTGLLDKNGRGIYEGDIVRNSYKYAQPHVCQVIIEGGNTYLSGEDLSTGGDMLLCDYADRCEVLGNIFETPKLLEVPE